MGDLAIFGFGAGGWGLALLEGAALTLLVSAAGLLIGAAIGGLVAWARLSGKRLAGAGAEAYAALFRGLPELLIVYFVYFGRSTLLTETARLFGHDGFVGVPSFAGGRARGRRHLRAPTRRRCTAPPFWRSQRANSRLRSASA